LADRVHAPRLRVPARYAARSDALSPEEQWNALGRGGHGSRPRRHRAALPRVLRDHPGSDARNYDALNAIAIAYFEINFRGEQVRELGSLAFMSEGFRAAHLAAVPWRAYGLVQEDALRDAILDFFEDATLGDKLGARATAGRLAGLIESFESKETNASRASRIRALLREIERMDPAPPAAPPAWAD
jgi:hypothetical protein